MALKTVHNDVLDAALNYLKDYGDREYACDTQPTTYTEATATYDLAYAALTSGDYTIENGTSGRKVTIATQLDKIIATTGTAKFVAIVDVSESKLLYVTTCADLYLTGGQLVDFGEWVIQIDGPT